MKAGLAPGHAESNPVPETIGQGGGNDLLESEAAESVECLFDPLLFPEQLRPVVEMLQGTPSAYPVKGAERFNPFRTWRNDRNKLGIEVSFAGGSHTDLHRFPREGSPDKNHWSFILKGNSANTVPK